MGLELDKYGEDYELTSDSAWISVKGFSLYIRKTDDGVRVDIYKRHDEMGETLDSAEAFDLDVLSSVVDDFPGQSDGLSAMAGDDHESIRQ